MSFIETGNAADLGQEYRGWFLGHFIADASSPFHSKEVEVKWANHSAGESRSEWSDAATTTVSILVRGQLILIFDDREHTLSREGDFVYWGKGVRHSWRCEKDSTILTVRWPSIPSN